MFMMHLCAPVSVYEFMDTGTHKGHKRISYLEAEITTLCKPPAASAGEYQFSWLFQVFLTSQFSIQVYK